MILIIKGATITHYKDFKELAVYFAQAK